MPIYLIGTLDTKGRELAFVKDLLQQIGLPTRVVDAGCLGEPAIAADVSRSEVFQAAGSSLEDVRAAGDRGGAVTAAAEGVARIIRSAHAAGECAGVLGIGGSAGTTIATAAMRTLPLGVPKVMVSTLASGQTRPYVGSKDILMLNPVVDISGINRISRIVLSEAAWAMAGMVTFDAAHAGESVERVCNRSLERRPQADGLQIRPTVARRSGDRPANVDKPLIAATMFGVTTPCVEHARQILETAGYEVLVFHATGSGGQAMESLIDEGLIAGVLDITTTELADELVGGVLSAGPDRLTAAGRKGVPQVISVGATDMVNFGPPESIPEKFSDRKFYQHNPTVTLMRTTVDENRRIGVEIGRKAATATGPTKIVLPLKGVSAIDAEGQPFDDPEARDALFEAIRESAGDVDLMERMEHVNDEAFAEAAAQELLRMMSNQTWPASQSGK